ncbi:MAG: CAP domain-containing protein [Chitinophagales bacterium]
MTVKLLTTILALVAMNACFLTHKNPPSPPVSIEENETSPSRPIDRNKANENIDINHFDISLMEDLVHEEINNLRAKKRRVDLQKDNCLRKAAILQNEYVMKQGKLTHEQRNKDMKSVMERTRINNCTHRMVGENLQFMGFTLVKQNGKLIDIETPTYNEAAKEIAQNWKGSPGHYDNLMHESFFRVGTAAAYDSREKGIYVTQVFGAVPPE